MFANPSSILSTPTGYPVIQMFANATAPSPGSDLRAASAMSSVLILACVAATINVLASASRMLWAFARERGLPCSAWLSRVHSIPWGGHQLTRTAISSTGVGNNKRNDNNNNTLPLNALLVTAATASLLALINIGSAVAFNALTSLVVLASYATFAVPAAVLLLKRVQRGRPTALAFGAFTLGRNAVAVPVVAAALGYSLLGAFFSLWPPTRRVAGPEELNWSGVVFGACVVWSLAYWAVWGRKVYVGPVLEVGVVRRAVGGGVSAGGEESAAVHGPSREKEGSVAVVERR
ncbi:hypothetical protein SLS54_001351 [Diplodia seriata]